MSPVVSDIDGWVVIPQPLVVPALAGIVGTQVVLALLTSHTGSPAYGSPQFRYWGEALQIVRYLRHQPGPRRTPWLPRQPPSRPWCGACASWPAGWPCAELR